MKDFCVVGSGIAGSTIASLLAKKHSVEIFDKARGPGGRSSNRRYKKNLSFDHGLQYISPSSQQFKKFILELNKKKILKEWNGNHLDFTFNKKEKSIKYIGIKGNNDICRHLIKNIKFNFLSTVTNIEFNSNYWTITLNNKNKVFFKNIILTCPLPQLIKLSSKYLTKKILNFKSKIVPNITIMVSYKNYKKIPVSSIVFNDKIIAWASCENTKNRFESNETLWTIQCTEYFSKSIINLFKKDEKKYQKLILKKFEQLSGYEFKRVIFHSIHGWRYAYNKINAKVDSVWLKNKKLGVCADWFCGPKAEDSWLSAHSLYKQIKKNPLKI